MSFVIWFGTRAESVRRGVVADACPTCREVLSFVVFDHFSVSHVYEIPLGRARFVGSTRYCTKCGGQLELDEAEYSDVLSFGEVSTLCIADGARRTNPRLAALLDMVDRLRALGERPAYRTPELESSSRLLSDVIGCFEALIFRGVDLARYLELLARWDRLSEREQEETAAELRGLVKVA